MPVSTLVEIFGAFDMQTFFSPSSNPIISITGGATSVRVTLQSGVVLVYEGTGLTSNGTQPTGGTVISVSVLDASGGTLAKLSLSAAPWNFADIKTDLPLQSYLATSHDVSDAFSGPALNSASNIFGGNQADNLSWTNGADTIRGLDGDDIFFTGARTGSTRPAGTIIDGGDGNDTIFVSSSTFTNPPSVVDMRDVAFRSIETIAVVGDIAQISAAQIGGGQIASDAVLFGTADGVLQIDQVAGRSVNVTGFQRSPTDLGSESLTINIIGTSANDLQIGSNVFNNQLEGFAGNDTLRGGANGDTIFRGAGNDWLYAGGTNPRVRQSDELYGGDGDDRLIGGSKEPDLAEALYGGNGNDTIIGGEFGSIMEGGAGNDYLRATSTDSSAGFLVGSFMTGGEGNDTLIGSLNYRDEMFGGMGDDLYRVNNLFTSLIEAVGEGYDRVVTSVDIDLSSGAFGQDAGEIERISVSGTVGLNVTGSASNNVIAGNTGADTLNGAAGDDRLLGQDGADVLAGGTGQDFLRGGSGEDTFVFATGFGRDIVADFAAGTDVIDLKGFDAVTSFDDLLADHATQVGQNVFIEGDNGDLLVLRNVSLSTLTADDFLF